MNIEQNKNWFNNTAKQGNEYKLGKELFFGTTEYTNSELFNKKAKEIEFWTKLREEWGGLKKYNPISDNLLVDAFGTKPLLRQLKQKLTDWQRFASKIRGKINNGEDPNSDWLNEDTIQEAQIQIKKIKNRILALENYNKPASKNMVTKEEIERARSYPIGMLIEFNRNRKAKCLWHEDKHPSLNHWRHKNQAKCFVCGALKDSIEIVRKIQNFTFTEAVRYLNKLV